MFFIIILAFVLDDKSVEIKYDEQKTMGPTLSPEVVAPSTAISRQMTRNST